MRTVACELNPASLRFCWPPIFWDSDLFGSSSSLTEKAEKLLIYKKATTPVLFHPPAPGEPIVTILPGKDGFPILQLSYPSRTRSIPQWLASTAQVPTDPFSLSDAEPYLLADPTAVTRLNSWLVRFRLYVLCRAIDGVLSRVRGPKKSKEAKDFVVSPFCALSRFTRNCHVSLKRDPWRVSTFGAPEFCAVPSRRSREDRHVTLLGVPGQESPCPHRRCRSQPCSVGLRVARFVSAVWDKRIVTR